MPRRQNSGPGPKSKTKNKTKNTSFLGDSTATEASDAESFQSPELEADHTDYGFNYTTSNSSPRNSRRSHRPQTPVARETNSSRRRSSPVYQNPRRSAQQVSPIASRKKNARKQLNPLKREQMIWKQIRELQKRTDNLTPKAPFGRIIREILMNESSNATKITYAALEALQTSSEIYLTNLFSDAYVCTLHRGRVTLGVHDVRLVRFLRGSSDVGNKH